MYREESQPDNESEEARLLHYHSKIFQEVDFRNWLAYFKRHGKHEQKITEQTFVKRSALYHKKQMKVISDSSRLRLHNHLEFNFYLGNKKALFYNIKRLCESRGEDPFKFLPLTFHISKGVEDPVYAKFLEHY